MFLRGQKILYGISDLASGYSTMASYVFHYEPLVEDLSYETARLLGKYPAVMEVYVVENDRGLKKEFMQCFKGERKLEARIAFVDFLRKEGTRLY